MSTAALTSNFAELSTSIRALSTGKRINTAADDPAGTAVADMMSADVAQFSQRSRNMAENKNYVQTAEGGAGKINDVLNRMNALASQATTGTTSPVGRQILNEEFQQLKSEANAIAARTRSAVPEGIAAVDDALAGLDSALAAFDGADLTSSANAAGARDAIKALHGELSKSQADMGTQMNVYDSQVSELNTRVENRVASYSRIADADIGTTTTAKAAGSIKSQFAVAMQAHQNISGALSLKLLQA